jgi:hypothetical protein
MRRDMNYESLGWGSDNLLSRSPSVVLEAKLDSYSVTFSLILLKSDMADIY